MNTLFDLTDRVIIVTGATGVLAGSAADYLASQRARVVYLGRSQEKLDAALAKCREKTPEAACLGLCADVLDRSALERARDLTVTYTNERIQFGQAVAKFQAVQVHLARLAEDAAQAPVIGRAQADFVTLMGVVLVLGPDSAR